MRKHHLTYFNLAPCLIIPEIRVSNDDLKLLDRKSARFCLLPKIHKRLHDVPGRTVISNWGFCTENIPSFLDYHFQPLAQRVKSLNKSISAVLKIQINSTIDLSQEPCGNFITASFTQYGLAYVLKSIR